MNRVALLVLFAGALVACSGQEPTTKCTTGEECPADARCVEQVCVQNRAPVAVIDAPGSPEVYALHTLSGAASSDPDDGDAVAAYHWTVVALEAACAPPAIASTTASAQVRFGCTGTYRVQLLVEDGLGVQSEAATAELVVTPSAAAPALSVGPDVVAAHTCSGAPLRCRPSTANGAVSLAGTSSLPAGTSYRWVVLPPSGRELTAGRRATFSPGPEVLASTVSIETDGLAISGDWVLRLEAYDAYGVLGAAATRLTITNQPPTVDGTLDPVPHAYDPVAQRFEASGRVQVTVADPDGDPVVREVTPRHLNDGASSTFQANDLGDSITFAIVVPYDSALAPGRLIGGAGLSREVELAVTDANGATATKAWSVVVGNRAPVRTGGAAAVGVPHTFDAAGGAYVASATLSSWSDPDGDPLELASASAAPCDAVTLTAGTVSVACRAAYTGVPAAAAFASERDVPDGARDPWAAVQHATPLTITNRAPAFTRTLWSSRVACTQGTCCDWDGEGCSAIDRDLASYTVASGAFLNDPDGDPVMVTFEPDEVGADPASRVCRGADCLFTFTVPPGTICTEASVTSFASAVVTDGGPAVSAPLQFVRSCD